MSEKNKAVERVEKIVEEAKEEGGKVTIFSIDPGESRVELDEDDRAFGGDVLVPPLPPAALARRYDESYSLRPNIDAYVTNIEGFGHRLEPIIDLSTKNSNEDIADAIMMEQLHTQQNLADIGDTSEEAVAAKREEIEKASRVERLRLEMFFANPAVGMSFIQLRKRMRRDLEVTGNAYLEVVRNSKTNRITQLALAPSVKTRLMKTGPAHKMEKAKRRVSPISFSTTPLWRRFRRYVQLLSGSNRRVFFKEIGDPRIMSSRTGRYYPSMSLMIDEEDHDEEATEIIHISLYDPQGPYGTPRWQGAMMAVLGGRASEEVNYSYFDEKTIPPGFLLVSGAPLKAGAAEKVENYLKEHIKGRRNFHSIVIIEAEGKAVQLGQQPPRARIEWVPMTDQQNQDALFQVYDERSGEKVGNMFRLPKILRGDMKDFNRSTATEALKYAEQQVFEPERMEFDELINEVLFLHMDIKYWRFVSNSPMNRDPRELAEILNLIGPKWLSGKENRKIIEDDILNIELEDREDEWTNLPFEIYKIDSGGSAPGGFGDIPPGPPVPEDPEGMADATEQMRDELAAAMGDEAEAEKALLSLATRPREVLKIDATEASKLFNFPGEKIEK